MNISAFKHFSKRIYTGMPVMPATWEVEIGRITVQGEHGQKVVKSWS
jgi:hypothetical protein